MSAPAEKLESTIEKSRLLQQAIINKAPIEVIQKLIKEGADVNYSERDLKVIDETIKETKIHYYGWPPGITSLMLAARHDRPDIVAELLSNKADVNTGNQIGMTALMYAARWKSIESAELLIKAGATVNNKTNPPPGPHENPIEFHCPELRQTALHFAIHCPGSKKIPSILLVQMLLTAGADIKKSDDCRRTPLNIALRNLAIFKTLRTYKTNPSGYESTDTDNVILALQNIIQLIWQRGSKIGIRAIRAITRNDINEFITSLDIFPEAHLVAQAEYCFATEDFAMSDLCAYEKFIMANTGDFAEPIVHYIRDSDRKMRAAPDSKKKMETEQEQKQVLDKKWGKEQYEASFVEAASNLIPPNSLQIYSLVREYLQPCSFGVTRIVIDYHHPSDYFPKGFHPMISRLTEKRLEHLNPKAEKEVPAQPKPKS